jgi:hypothetical protein
MQCPDSAGVRTLPVPPSHPHQLIAEAAVYMVVAFERGRLVYEVGGDGTGLTVPHAIYLAHDLREEYPGAIVAILPARRSWEGGWPWSTARRAHQS